MSTVAEVLASRAGGLGAASLEDTSAITFGAGLRGLTGASASRLGVATTMVGADAATTLTAHYAFDKDWDTSLKYGGLAALAVPSLYYATGTGTFGRVAGWGGVNETAANAIELGTTGHLIPIYNDNGWNTEGLAIHGTLLAIGALRA
jgi:hypothetical protein